MRTYVKKLKTLSTKIHSWFTSRQECEKELAVYYAVVLGDYFYSNVEKTRISSTMPFIKYTLYNEDISESSPKNRASFIRGNADRVKIASIIESGVRDLKLE